MTKQEALQKIEELRKFVDGLDKQKLVHGDLVCLGGHTEVEGKRIVIDTTCIEDRDKRYIFLDKNGEVCNNVKDLSYTFAKYTKIRNVFKD